MKVNGLIYSLFTLFLLAGCTSSYKNLNDNVKVVEHTSWSMYENVIANNVIAKKIPENMVSLIFFRDLDSDAKQTSANIAINDRFQVSLQPNNYTQVFSCAGINNISVVITGQKSNDLSKNAQAYTLTPNEVYFFKIDVDDETNNVSFMQVEQQVAQKSLAGKTYQTHQISRVLADNCAEPVKVEIDKPISLHVEFDFNSAVIRTMYNRQLQAVA